MHVYRVVTANANSRHLQSTRILPQLPEMHQNKTEIVCTKENSSNRNRRAFSGNMANTECQLTGSDCLISSGTLVRYQECDCPAEVARTPPVFCCSTVLWYWYWLPWTSVSVPPRACSTASGAHVSHFLHPGLAKIYACALPSISRRTYTRYDTHQLQLGCTSSFSVKLP